VAGKAGACVNEEHPQNMSSQHWLAKVVAAISGAFVKEMQEVNIL
jgi:hypothetical protein